MALSTSGHLLLTTGNKSELAVWILHALWRHGWRAGRDQAMFRRPWFMSWRAGSTGSARVIQNRQSEKAPSAELKRIREIRTHCRHTKFSIKSCSFYVEENLVPRDIIARGFDEKTVRWVQRRVDLNEYKREQSRSD